MQRQSLAGSGRPTLFPHVASPHLALHVQRRVLAWFRRAQRELPWRRTHDPYAIWVSEIMLQQTQVATVVPFYERFLTAFPTLAALAAAPERDVLKLWEGLGYYQRARSLHAAARIVVANHDGAVPRDPELLRKLPGIGQYTAGAILSLAFDLRLPIVEANSARVLCRLFACKKDVKSTRVRQWLWRAAESLLPSRPIGEFNQALMEVGALVCTPRQPRCDSCPLANCCAACAGRCQEQIPRQAKPPRTTTITEAALVVRRRDAVLLVQRPATGRWANLWEFPHGEVRNGETHPAAARRVCRELTGIQVGAVQELATIRHGITRFTVTIRCFAGRSSTGRFHSRFYQQGCWVRAERLAEFPLSVPQRKIARTLMNGQI